jgi:hypothetical protein
MEREAISLAQHGVLGNPYALPTGPSAHVCPGYAIVLAAIFYLFGSSLKGEAVKIAVTILISSVQYALLPWLGRLLRLPSRISLTAGLVGALVPLNPYIEIQGDFENHLTALLLLLLIAWTECAAGRSWSLAEAAAIGIFYGICALTSSPLIPLCALSLAFIALQQFRAPDGRPLAALLALSIAVLCLLPWVIRNYMELGSPIATRSNLGLELYLSNNDLASPLMAENGRLYMCCHPLQNENEARKVQQLGEVEYNARLLHQAWQWIRTHPARFARLVALRFWFTWMPEAPEQVREFLFRTLTPLSLLGLIFLWRLLRNPRKTGAARRAPRRELRGSFPDSRRPSAPFALQRKSALLLAVPVIVYPLPFYLTQVHFRYRYPLDFIILLTACVAVFELLKGFRRRIA